MKFENFDNLINDIKKYLKENGDVEIYPADVPAYHNPEHDGSLDTVMGYTMVGYIADSEEKPAEWKISLSNINKSGMSDDYKDFFKKANGRKNLIEYLKEEVSNEC